MLSSSHALRNEREREASVICRNFYGTYVLEGKSSGGESEYGGLLVLCRGL